MVAWNADASAQVVALWEAGRAESMAFAERLRMAAEFGPGLDDDDGTVDPDELDINDMAVAVALRMTTAQANMLIRDGHAAVRRFPRTLERLSAGDMPKEWFSRLLRTCRDLPETACAVVDERVSAWELESIPVARFRRELRLLVSWLSARVESGSMPSPESMRDVALADVDAATGTARFEIVGPIPEILSLAHRLDENSRAIQQRQRKALESGTDVPFDLDGTVAATAIPLSLRALRYATLTRTALETDGVEIPASRFRLNVTVPMLTLLGVSDTSGVIEGEHPIPAEMARALAADENVWYRILTDPVTGIYLPAQAESYRPTTQMREHLRLRHPVCAAPGCTRPTTRTAEIDHIHEFDHDDPSAGGLTELTNLHLLCWRHHQLKTSRLIDPTREPEPPRSAPQVVRQSTQKTHPPGLRSAETPDRPNGEPGADQRQSQPAARWRLGHGIEVLVDDARDLFTPNEVAILESAWAAHQQLDALRREHGARRAAMLMRESGSPPGTARRNDPAWSPGSEGYGEHSDADHDDAQRDDAAHDGTEHDSTEQNVGTAAARRGNRSTGRFDYSSPPPF